MLHSWEHEMPMTGPDHEQMIENLKHRGICQEAKATGAHRVADAIWNALYSRTTCWMQVSSGPSTTRAQIQEPLQLAPDPVIQGRDVHLSGTSIHILTFHGNSNSILDGIQPLLHATTVQHALVNIPANLDSEHVLSRLENSQTMPLRGPVIFNNPASGTFWTGQESNILENGDRETVGTNSDEIPDSGDISRFPMAHS